LRCTVTAAEVRATERRRPVRETVGRAERPVGHGHRALPGRGVVLGERGDPGVGRHERPLVPARVGEAAAEGIGRVVHAGIAHGTDGEDVGAARQEDARGHREGSRRRAEERAAHQLGGTGIVLQFIGPHHVARGGSRARKVPAQRGRGPHGELVLEEILPVDPGVQHGAEERRQGRHGGGHHVGGRVGGAQLGHRRGRTRGQVLHAPGEVGFGQEAPGRGEGIPVGQIPQIQIRGGAGGPTVIGEQLEGVAGNALAKPQGRGPDRTVRRRAPRHGRVGNYPRRAGIRST